MLFLYIAGGLSVMTALASGFFMSKRMPLNALSANLLPLSCFAR